MIRLDQIRSEEAQNFGNYEDFLRALEMRAVIHNFEPLYIERITQLVNKTNQFNLTTKRCTQSELESWMQSPSRICLYGRLIDKYGDNGITTIVSGSIEQDVLKIDLWLMSCRVLKRGLESAMMDELAAHAKEKDVTEIQGFYISTEKNQMTADFYEKMGFTLISRNGKDSSWKMRVADYQPKNTIIKIEQE